MEQLLHLVFVFTAAGNLVMDEFLCNSNAKCEINRKTDKFNCNGTNSTAKSMNSTANWMKSIAKMTNSIAKTCNSDTYTK